MSWMQEQSSVRCSDVSHTVRGVVLLTHAPPLFCSGFIYAAFSLVGAFEEVSVPDVCDVCDV